MTDKQTTIPVEADLRRKGWIADPKMKLHNGEEWHISPMPLGSRCKNIKDHIFNYFESTESGNQKQIYDAVEDMGRFAWQILQINYPALQYEQIDYLVTMAELRDLILYVMHGKNAPKIIEELDKESEGPEKNVASPQTTRAKKSASGNQSKK